MKFYKLLIFTFFTYTLISCGGAEERKAVYLDKAKASIEAGDLVKARVELKNVLQIDPKDGEAYYQLGNVYEKQKEYRKAYFNYLKAEELRPDLLSNQAILGRFYLVLMNDVEKAQEKVDLILSKEVDNPYGLLLKAAVMLRSDNTTEAINIAKGIISKNPGHLEGTEFLAAIYIGDNKAKDAISLLDETLKNNRYKDNKSLNRLLVLALVAEKNYERAEVIYTEFLERNPNNVASYNDLAAFYSKMGDEAKAEAILRASVDNDSSDEGRILTLIKYIREMKGNGEAIKHLKRFVSLNSDIGKLRLALAELYSLNDDRQSFVDVLKKAISDFSNDNTAVSARTALSSMYLKNRDYAQAAEIIDDALTISPNDPESNFLKAKLAVLDKDMEQAIISLRIVTKEMPENIGAFILLAGVYQQEGNEAQAKSIIITAYEKNKTNTSALLKLAKYQFTRDINHAEKIIDHYNNIKQFDYDGLTVKTEILIKNKKLAEAYEITKVQREKYPDRSNGYSQAVPYFEEKKDIRSAISMLEKGYAAVKNNRKILKLLTVLQIKEKEFGPAVVRIEEEIATSPDDVKLKILLAKVLVDKKDTDSAVKLLKEVLVIKPEVEYPYLLLSLIYKSNGEFSSVKEVLAKGFANVKTSLKIPMKLASQYELEESYDDAITIYKDLYKTHPENIFIVNNLASLLSDFGNGENDLLLAKTLIDKLKSRDESVFFDTIGWVHYRLGDFHKAVQYLTQAIEKTPNVNIFKYHLGMAYKMSGDKTKAKVFFEKSLDDKKAFKEKAFAEKELKNL